MNDIYNDEDDFDIDIGHLGGQKVGHQNAVIVDNQDIHLEENGYQEEHGLHGDDVEDIDGGHLLVEGLRRSNRERVAPNRYKDFENWEDVEAKGYNKPRQSPKQRKRKQADARYKKKKKPTTEDTETEGLESD